MPRRPATLLMLAAVVVLLAGASGCGEGHVAAPPDAGATGAAGTGGSGGTGRGGNGDAGAGGDGGAGGAGGVAGTSGGGAGSEGGRGGAGGVAGAAGSGGSGGAPGRGGAGGSGGASAGNGGSGGRGGATAGSGGRGGSGGASGRGGSGGLANVTVFVAGDSTVQTYVGSAIHQGGWGQFFDTYFVTQVTVDNRAIGGRTSRRFIEEGRLTTILNAARAGDWLFVQFGTNDSNQTATYDDGEPYYLAPATDFKTWMQMYIDGAKARGVTPVLVTPPPRNSCRSDGVSFNYSFTSYANAMKELGQTNGVAVVDLGARAVTYLNGKADCDWASANFFLVRADGTVDGTHFQETGANILAGLVVEGIRAAALPLAAYAK